MQNRKMTFEMKVNPETEDSADLYIFDAVGESWLDNEKNISTAKAFHKALDKAGNVKELNIHVNSCGGYCDDGVAIYSMLKNHSAVKNAYVDGYACSIASLIVAACDKVHMSKPACMQIHNAITLAYGNAKALRAQADTLDKITEGIKDAYLDRAGDKLTAEKLTELMDGKDGDGTMLTAKECLQYGFCDVITGAEDSGDSEIEPKPEPQNKAEPPTDRTNIINTFRAFML